MGRNAQQRQWLKCSLLRVGLLSRWALLCRLGYVGDGQAVRSVGEAGVEGVPGYVIPIQSYQP